MGLSNTIETLNTVRADIASALRSKGAGILDDASLKAIHQTIKRDDKRTECRIVNISNYWYRRISEPGSLPANDPSSFKTVDLSNIYWTYAPTFGQTVTQEETLKEASITVFKSDEYVYLSFDVEWLEGRHFQYAQNQKVYLGTLAEEYRPVKGDVQEIVAVITNSNRERMEGIVSTLDIHTDGRIVVTSSPQDVRYFSETVNRVRFNILYSVSGNVAS